MSNARVLFPNLAKAVNAAHPRGGMQTAAFCVCGAGMGGPVGSDACRDLERLERFLDSLNLDLPQCPECRTPILPNERFTNLMTRKTWEEDGSLCPECRFYGNKRR